MRLRRLIPLALTPLLALPLALSSNASAAPAKPRPKHATIWGTNPPQQPGPFGINQPNPQPHWGYNKTITVALPQSDIDGQVTAGVPAKYQMDHLVYKTTIPAKPTAQAIANGTARAAYSSTTMCQGNFPLGVHQEVDGIANYGLFQLTVAKYMQDVYWCWDYATDMLVGQPEVQSRVSTNYGWSFGGEFVAHCCGMPTDSGWEFKADTAPYPYVFHAARMGVFNWLGQGFAFQKKMGLDGYGYWNGAWYAGPYFTDQL